MKKLLSFVLALASIVSLFSGITYAAGAPANSGEPGQAPVFDASEDVREPEEPVESAGPADPGGFREDLFSDVHQGEWYFSNVKTAYELGLMKGRGEDVFVPLGGMNLAEAITVAARLRSAYTGDNRDFSGGTPWYAPAVEYAVTQGIIQEGVFADYMAEATRAQVAYIFSGALPSGALEEVNTVEDNSLPDVKMGDAYAPNIYLLYRAGILSGKDEKGTFSPSGATTRAEAAAIATRIASPSLRESCEFHTPPADPEPTPSKPADPEPTPSKPADPEPTPSKPTPSKPTYPDLRLRTRAGDSFFADAAFLGNSLVDGLRLYSKFKTADFYCGTSMSVISALYTKNVQLKNGTKGTQLAAMAQKQYGKVYIELGINEIGGSVNTFIKNYRILLDKIRAAQPKADIYIMAITPVSKAKSQEGVFTRERVKTYNAALYKLAAEWGCYYLDDFTPLADSSGYLPSSATRDGVHFTVAKYKEWEEIIRTHYA